MLSIIPHALAKLLISLIGTCLQAHGIIEMPNPPSEKLILESFIETDNVVVTSPGIVLAGALSEDSNSGSLSWLGKSRWLEVTVGVMGKKGEMYALNPSITVKESGAILSLEEKFQGSRSFSQARADERVLSFAQVIVFLLLPA